MDSYDMSKLKGALEDAGVQLSWALCQNFITNLINEIEGLDDHIDTINNVALRTFESANVSITIGSTSKSFKSDEETCQKILQSGANKGKKCSLSRTANSEFCKRHLNMMMKSGNVHNEDKKKQIASFRDVIDAKKKQRKTTANLKLRGIDNMPGSYVDLDTKLIFVEEDDQLKAVGHMYGEDIKLLSKTDIKLCDINGWEYALKQ